MVTQNRKVDHLESMHGSTPRTAVEDDALVPWTQRRQVAAPTVAIAVVACLCLVGAVIYLLIMLGTLTVRVAPSDPSAGALVQRQIAADAILMDFATQIGQIQYGWTPVTVQTVAARLSPYLSPKVRTEFLQQFMATAQEAKTYERANFINVTGAHVFDREQTQAAVAVHLDLAVSVYNTTGGDFRHSRFEDIVVVYRLTQGMSTPENPVGLIISGVEVVSSKAWKDGSREVFW